MAEAVQVQGESSRPRKWDEKQIEVINAPSTARMVVEAGPGTGKTAVACARVAKLLKEDDLNPSQILMISFTRTAVAEMKNRIRSWYDADQVNAVNICTLDQAAFSFGLGSGGKFEKLMESFDNNIDAAVEAFEDGNPLLLEYMSRFRHMIIDEAQDLTGPRCRLANLLIRALPAVAGVTIFADQAQAIYGFTNDVDGEDPVTGNFIEQFDCKKNGFGTVQLDTIHRTKDPAILELFKRVRSALLDPGTPAERVKKVVAAAENAGADLGDQVDKLPLADGDLVLYRKRASALMHAQFCPRLFRLRLPGYPPPVFPWIALVFSDWEEPTIDEEDFNVAWRAVPDSLRDNFDANAAWSLLLRFCKDRGGVSVQRLRRLTSRPRPPVEFCQVDYGGVGPIFSTIHASKGREAERVFLMLPRKLDYLENGKLNNDEEARVFYVGATRMRRELLRGRAQTMVRAGRLDKTGRRVAQILALTKRPKIQIGLAGDIDDAASISRTPDFCDSDMAATVHQEFLKKVWLKIAKRGWMPHVNAVSNKVTVSQEHEYRYAFSIDDTVIAWSAIGLTRDLWLACKTMKERCQSGNMRPPDSMERMRLIGLRTCTAPDDPALTANLREPFSSSGFWLAPMIVGFPSIFLPFMRNRGYSQGGRDE